MDKDRLAYLFSRYLTKEYSKAERAELEEALRQEDNAQWLEQYSSELKDLPYTQITLDESTTRSILNSIMVVISSKPEENHAPVHRIHFLRTAWFRYAAAIIIMLGIGTYLYINNTKEKSSVTQNNPLPVQNDVAPGGNRATLTLADGSKIILDSTKSGQIAKEENATITKTADGKIVYDADEKLGDRILFNTMSTPRGGQYQLRLPDGSQVWLNAESSITYPTSFAERERRVSVTGEAYFEVAKDKAKKFIVSVEDRQDVEVLGTHFNVNAYKDEETINTTLLEGSIRLTSHVSRLTNDDSKKQQTSVHTSLILKPGQQGQLSANKLSLAVKPDIDQVMAWKSGLFVMNDTDLPTIMRQISRWYDIDVIYEDKATNATFGGVISRNLPLSGILDLLKNAGVSFRLDGRKLYVRP